MEATNLFKDTILATLAGSWNVAQFVSFSPTGNQRHCAIRGFDVDFRFTDAQEAIRMLLGSSPEGRVRVRSFDPVHHRSQPFTAQPISSLDQVLQITNELSESGLHTIVNESIDINDGGVSGVAHGCVVEFAPASVPRCVEEGNVCSFPAALGRSVLKSVYSCDILEHFKPSDRVEFSLHPEPRGYRAKKYIVWEQQELTLPVGSPEPFWPNRFSEHIGDKVFGLLVADSLGFKVPHTLVIPRYLPPFQFGRHTHSGEFWLRTSPMVQEPGRFTTKRGWIDPFELMMREDPEGVAIPSVVKQDGVSAFFSGAAHQTQSADILIEGVRGTGEDFMTARAAPEELPVAVKEAVKAVGSELSRTFKVFRFEWVYDGVSVWIVQLHASASGNSREGWVFEGNAKHFVPFDASEGLESLRKLAVTTKEHGNGILVMGDIGFTSHICDVLRQLQVPSRLVSS